MLYEVITISGIQGAVPEIPGTENRTPDGPDAVPVGPFRISEPGRKQMDEGSGPCGAQYIGVFSAPDTHQDHERGMRNNFV